MNHHDDISTERYTQHWRRKHGYTNKISECTLNINNVILRSEVFTFIYSANIGTRAPIYASAQYYMVLAILNVLDGIVDFKLCTID